MSTKIKLLLYSHDWFPLTGGVQTLTLLLGSGLVDWGKTHAEESFEFILVTETERSGMDDSKLPFRVVRRPSIGKLFGLIRWADAVDLAGPTLLPLALTWMLRKPTVLDHHGYQTICPNGLLLYEPEHRVCPGYFMAGRYDKCVQCNKKEMGLLGSIRSLFLTFPRRWLAKKVSANVGTSPHVGQRVELPHTIMIWNGVAATDGAQSNGELGVKGSPICFGYLGRLVTEKGLPVLLRASRDLAAKGYSFRLKIVGDGPERAVLEKLARDYGLADRTEFLGVMPANAIREALRGVAAIVMPSVWEDVSPTVAMEQMMEGRLLIVSNIGGLGQIVDGGGIVFPPGDAGALAGQMLRVLEDPDWAAELGRTGREKALASFRVERMVAEHADLYRSLIHQDSPRRRS
jgi:glycosyltransferase involved in cell wall biosynthesis